MKPRQAKAHMAAAYVYANLSYCKRRQVGCVLVQDSVRIISIGYNGTPTGACNCCEDETGATLPSVIHAEDNAFRKLPNKQDAEGSVMFATTCPCEQCAAKAIEHKVSAVYYDHSYKDSLGLDLLRAHNIPTYQLSP